MKKLFFIAAIAGAALVSCTKNELAPSATEQHEITFASPVTSALTKSSVALVKNNYPTTSAFAVFADYHTVKYDLNGSNTENNFSSYMRGNADATRRGQGVKVTHNANGESLTVDNVTYDSYWRPATKYYWPMEGYLTFAAYSPYEITNYGDFEYTFANGVKFTGYEVSAANQYDLMLSDRAINQERSSMDENWDPTPNDNNTTNATPYDGVNINFRHALSAIRFDVKTDKDYLSPDGYKITLNSLTVTAKSKGDLTQFKTIDSKTADIIWTNQDESIDYTVQNAPVVLSTGSALLGTDVDNANLVLMPQNLTGVTVTINYTVNHADYPAAGITYNKPIAIATTVDEWVAGKRYLYTITIGMEEIVFAPTVTDWVDEPNKDINL